MRKPPTCKMEQKYRILVSGSKSNWAQDYERSLISAEMQFPRKGDITVTATHAKKHLCFS